MVTENIQSEIVKYSNYVVRASQRLTLAEQRIILSAISQVPNRPITVDDKFFITVADYKKLCIGTTTESVYRDMKEAMDTLFMRFITLDIDDQGKVVGKIRFHWVSSAEYRPGEGRVAVRFGYEMIPYVNKLRENFTKFNLGEITGFRSAYTQPLYVRLMQFKRDLETQEEKSLWTEVIGLDHLKSVLDATRYANFALFRKKVLDIAIKQINDSEFTKFTVKYAVFGKERQKVVSLKFTMKAKPQALVDQTPDADLDTPDLFTGISVRQATLTEKQKDMYADMLCGINQKNKSLSEEFYRFVRKNHGIGLNYHVDFDKEHYKQDVVQLLEDPNFVIEIFEEFLKPLGFKPVGYVEYREAK